jgi:hypothetical protein
MLTTEALVGGIPEKRRARTAGRPGGTTDY